MALSCQAGARSASSLSLRDGSFRAPRARSRFLLSHCVTALGLPAPRAAGCGLASPQPVRPNYPLRGPAPLRPPHRRYEPPHPTLAPPKAGLAGLRPRPKGAIRLGPLGVRTNPRRRLPNAARASGAHGLRRHLPPAAPAFEPPHPSARDTQAGPKSPRVRAFRACRPRAGVVVRSDPWARGAMAPKRAGTERPDRRVETLAEPKRQRRRGTARLRTPGRACSVAREGGSEGCARCAARATAHSPRGKRKPHGVP